MKYYLVILIDFWIIRGEISGQINDENDFQYWKTRFLSGSDYGSDYNVNHTTPKMNFRDDSSMRILFSWGTNATRKEKEGRNFTFFGTDEDFMPSDDKIAKNDSNIWWPWSNYEEWALSRKRNSLVNSSSERNSLNKNPDETKKKKKRRKKKKNKKSDNKVPTEIFKPKPQTFFSFETNTDKTTNSERNPDLRNSIHFFSKEDSQNPEQQTIPKWGQNSAIAPKVLNGSWDNNEMDNEIQMQPRYNYYDSIPIMNTKNTLIDKIKKYRNLDTFMKGYSSRNFTDDINECLIDNGGCEGLCINTVGSFKCHCPDGFKVDGHKCIDINECLLRNGHGPCQGKCINQWGGYKCSCEDIPGTRLAKDGHTCEDIDECKERTAGCSHQCINTVGSAFCLCPAGFMLDGDWKTCSDINECELTELQEIKCENGCINTIGSYTCL